MALLFGVLVCVVLFLIRTPQEKTARYGMSVNIICFGSDSLLKHYVQERVKGYEGCILHVSNGLIGYGHLIRPDESLESITQTQADSIFNVDFSECVYLAYQLYPDYSYNKHLAIASLIYNIGMGTFYRYDLQQSIDTTVWLSICNYKGTPHSGLLERRKFEVRVFNWW